MKSYVRFVTAAIATAVTSTAIFAGSSAYLGQDSRGIKAFSDEETGAYLTGKGMGMAKAAELNGYPGPAHVLELATDLGLTAEQRSRTEALFDSMSKEAIALGTELIGKERILDQLFSSKHIDQTSLTHTLEQIGNLQARLRGSHLAAHLAQIEILTPVQTARYIELRGYGTAASGGGHGQHRH